MSLNLNSVALGSHEYIIFWSAAHQSPKCQVLRVEAFYYAVFYSFVFILLGLQVCFRGHNIFQGYWDDEVKTREALDANRWFMSGDLAEMTEDRYVKIVGRIKDMVIRGGENIYPTEIENFLYRHPKIEDVQVDNYIIKTLFFW